MGDTTKTDRFSENFQKALCLDVLTHIVTCSQKNANLHISFNPPLSPQSLESS